MLFSEPHQIMKNQTHSTAKSGNTAEPKKSALPLNSDVHSLRGTVVAANKMNITTTKKFATATGNRA
jgi:hypothetical protein